MGNFGVEPLSADPNYSKSGTWYSYFEGDSIQVSDLHAPVSLDPGQYRLLTSKRFQKPEITAGIERNPRSGDMLSVYPNPVHGILRLEPLPVASRLRVFRSSGELVLYLDIHANQDRVDLSTLTPGLYILSRSYGNGAARHVKVMVQ